MQKTIKAAYLDPRVIVRHDFDRYLATLAPYSRQAAREDEGDSPKSAYVVQIRTGFALDAAPKMRGSLTVRPVVPGQLLFTAKFTVAYAFQPPDSRTMLRPLDTVAAVKSRNVYRYYAGSRWDATSHGVHIGRWRYQTFSTSCEAAQEGYLAPFYADPRWTASDPEHEVEYYFDPDQPLTNEKGCAD